jgi:hypothetical protein
MQSPVVVIRWETRNDRGGAEGFTRKGPVLTFGVKRCERSLNVFERCRSCLYPRLLGNPDGYLSTSMATIMCDVVVHDRYRLNHEALSSAKPRVTSPRRGSKARRIIHHGHELDSLEIA